MLHSGAVSLTPWANFYIVIGSASAALTGLMFVVITLVTGVERSPNPAVATATFSTPTVVHFGAVLFISLALIAPWHDLLYPDVLLGLGGATGIIYMVRVLHLGRHLTTYDPDAEDWAWYSILPFLAYGAILCGAMILPQVPAQALFVLAGGATVLIFIGIHNAWDIVTYLTIEQRIEPPNSDEPSRR